MEIDTTKFDILSQGYVRDADTIYLVMARKLKPIKSADADSFAALGTSHGRDATTGYFRDKRMRLAKGRGPADLRPLGHVYATDGTQLYFTTQKVPPPDGIDLSGPGLRLRWFDENEVNMPHVALTDGAGVWMSLTTGPDRWVRLDGADFDTLAPLGEDVTLPWCAPYFRDVSRVWYRGLRLPDASPDAVRVCGAPMLTDGTRAWVGARLLDAPATGLAYIDRYHLREDAGSDGVLLHHGDRVAFHAEADMTRTLATARSATERADLTQILRDLFTTMATLFAHYPPLVSRVGKALSHMQENTPPAPDLPDFTARLTTEGQIALDFADGTTLSQPATAWYTLGCHLWAHTTGRPAALLPYPPLGTMLPRSTDAQTQLITAHSAAFHALIARLWQAGHTDAARTLAHFTLCLARDYRDLTEDALQHLADLPRDLMSSLHYRPAHYHFGSTTNLAVARLIVADGWLDAPDIRDRIDVTSTLHGALLSTSKTALFFKVILHAVQNRFTAEPDAAVREQLATLLDAFLVKGQVDAEVNRVMHHAAMLPVIEFCIANAINTVFNRARLAETLWALNRDPEAEATAEALIAEIGEDAHLPGVYANRHIYRTPRLWFLRGRVDASWRKAPDLDTHKSRLDTLEAEYSALLDRYGKDAAQWPEMQDIRAAIDRYAAGIRAA
ncbi:hypothetical protein [Roseovarius confluentis]|uniref:hypothetical protein n=1 Tax=Roseovarius confluentis TaxID=1852027 RepID=UPI000CDE3376|nr:hypothetical protein [Roseovarius confluentis]